MYSLILRLIFLFIITADLNAERIKTKKFFFDSVNINIVSSKNSYYPIDTIARVSDINNLNIYIPYKVQGGELLLPDYFQEVDINKKIFEKVNSNVKATLSWNSQLLKGNGFLKAKVTIDGDINAKFIQLSLLKEKEILKFDYLSNYTGKKSHLIIKLVGSIKSKNFDSSKNKYIYFPIKSFKTNRIWLNNNLGSEYNNINSPYFNPYKKSIHSKDHLAFGKLYEWTENVCPDGFRIPTKEEFIAEIDNFEFRNSFLNLTYAGMRGIVKDNILFAGQFGSYWLNSSTKKEIYGVLRIYDGKLLWNTAYKKYGFSVRCIRDDY
ncbi:hypothetical protein Arnit_1507 [Arcobacter nitrofigilis DSM 7299]|uniref:Uncharacterized protein n=1 Tax=Arcobacter nitrofigilis (strain ATCC 33309 / DSM 7299 / CCUG 15893 / LMG 7604 / NCTC 12251 / CI) TaxID=572480 RepID=D5V5Z6_ARCNC|nr:FISUMP domain-containing protein [Arcobacter nitrofigilis]ADG93163.1 hypothetical protein Arnit_1507 [Arcobacter nitrofigilis DSM 7299]